MRLTRGPVERLPRVHGSGAGTGRPAGWRLPPLPGVPVRASRVRVHGAVVRVSRVVLRRLHHERQSVAVDHRGSGAGGRDHSGRHGPGPGNFRGVYGYRALFAAAIPSRTASWSCCRSGRRAPGCLCWLLGQTALAIVLWFRHGAVLVSALRRSMPVRAARGGPHRLHPRRWGRVDPGVALRPADPRPVRGPDRAGVLLAGHGGQRVRAGRLRGRGPARTRGPWRRFGPPFQAGAARFADLRDSGESWYSLACMRSGSSYRPMLPH